MYTDELPNRACVEFGAGFVLLLRRNKSGYISMGILDALVLAVFSDSDFLHNGVQGR